MATAIHNVLNQLLATSFSDVGKTTALPLPYPQQQPQIGGAQQAEEQADQQQQQPQNTYQQPAQERQQSLKDMSRPQVALGPSEETALYSEDSDASAGSEVVQSSFISDEANSMRRSALGQGNQISDSLRQRAQQAVSALYARNNDIVYNTQPAYSEAV